MYKPGVPFIELCCKAMPSDTIAKDTDSIAANTTSTVPISTLWIFIRISLAHQLSVGSRFRLQPHSASLRLHQEFHWMNQVLTED
jgi:hypothetical protein